MPDLTIYETPELDSPALLAAFAGWGDAAGAATGALKYLAEHLGATKLAELDPERYYDFSQVRPITRLTEQGERYVTWPENQFFYWKGTAESRDLLFFTGVEPNLRWRAYAGTVLDLAQQHGVSQMVVLGALLDSVPHTREPRISGAANRPELRQRLEGLGAPITRYEGPTGIAGVLLDTCRQQALPYVSLWGHCPHYLQAMANPMVSLALLEMLLKLLPLPLDLAELRRASRVFRDELTKAIAQEPRLEQYVAQLEQAYDQGGQPSRPMPTPEELMRDLDEFLRGRRQGDRP
ncbi:MAG: PAC2 family protein [Chloroflexi bacterium]|nr:PAC2 family protein [Chloroflexota bacterium]